MSTFIAQSRVVSCRYVFSARTIKIYVSTYTLDKTAETVHYNSVSIYLSIYLFIYLSIDGGALLAIYYARLPRQKSAASKLGSPRQFSSPTSRVNILHCYSVKYVIQIVSINLKQSN